LPETNRRDPRVKATVPIIVDGRTAGMTKDVSASGVFFETDEDMADGSPIEFTVELESPSGKLVLRCSGQIVRVDRSGGKLGVAAKILDSKLEMKNETIAANAVAASPDGTIQPMAAAR
jgi:hypothetical protein